MSKLKSLPPLSVMASAAAIVAIAGASGLLNAWGWHASAAGLVALVLVVLVVGSEVLGITLALATERAWAHKARVRALVSAALLIGVSVFNAYSGHRALTMIEQERAAPYLAAQSARTEAAAVLARIEADLAAVPALPANVPASRLRAYVDARNTELARLEPQRAAAQQRLDALPVVAEPPPGIDPAVMKMIVVLIELLKVFGLWAVAEGYRAAQPHRINAGAELARARWAKRA